MLRIHNLAKSEIREAADWYGHQRPDLDRQFLAEVREALEAIEADFQRFAKLETIGPRTTFRRALLDTFPYFVVFRVLENEVFVYAVAHTSRRPNYWRHRKRNS
jgi:toxin ParE1/3/4